MGGDGLNELIGDWYAAARDGAQWQPLLERLARTFAADRSVLLGCDAERQEPWACVGHGTSAALVERLVAMLADGPRRSGPTWPAGRPFTYRLQLAAGVEHHLGFVDEIEPGVILAVAMFRAHGAAPFPADACDALGRLAPHIANAARIMRQLGTARATAAATAEALEKLSAAVMLVDRGARVVSANRAARALAPVSGLAVRGGALRIERQADDRALRAAIAAVLGAQDRGGLVPPAAREVTIHGAGGRTLVLRVCALDEGAAASGEPRSRALAVVHALAADGAPHPQAQVLVPAYGLSAAESELLDGLLGGLRLAEIAASRGTSRETARSQLKSIFYKTGVSTQSDLVALVTGGGMMQPQAHGAAVAAL